MKHSMKRSKSFILSTAFLLVLVLSACGPDDETADVVEESAPAEAEFEDITEPTGGEGDLLMASADLQTADGRSVGTVWFRSLESGEVELSAELSGLEGARAGEHGLHVHENGECEPPTFESAGGHFDPTGAPHGAPDDSEHHAGDFGNITISEDGSGEKTVTSQILTVAPGPNSVVGKAVVLHEGQDDLVSQPTGDAGGRLACGVVALSSEQYTDETMVDPQDDMEQNDSEIY